MDTSQIVQNSRVAQDTQDNATATATCTAGVGERSYVLGFLASYSIAVAAVKAITITFTPEGASSSQTIIVDWDFTNGPCSFMLPAPVHGTYGNDPTVALAASGSGGTSGRIYAFYTVG